MFEFLVAGVAVKAITRKVGKDKAGKTAEEELAVLRSGKPLSARLTLRPALRALIRKYLDQHECQYRGRAKDEDWLLQCSGPLVLDHKVPLNQGGDNTLDNFQFLCTKHNSSKSDHTEQAFFVQMRERRDSKARDLRDKLTAKLKREAILKAKKAQASQAKAIAARAKSGAAPARKPRPPKKSGGFLEGLFG
jgi:hypothetical protein